MKIFILCLIMYSAGFCFAESCDEMLSRAADLYSRDDVSGAAALYLQAGESGCAEAYWYLAERCSANANEALEYYIQSAKLGHEKGLQKALSVLIYEVDSLKDARPEYGLQLYTLALKVNPEIIISDEELQVLRICAEVPALDIDILISTYNFRERRLTALDTYYVWRLAEQASRGDMFDNPDMLLTLQLLIRGGVKKKEFIKVIPEYYSIWKNGGNKTFVLNDYISYITKQQFSFIWDYRDNDTFYTEHIAPLLAELSVEEGALLKKAYTAAEEFFVVATFIEDGFEVGVWTADDLMWEMDTLEGYKGKFLEVFKRLKNDLNTYTFTEMSIEDAELKLEQTYVKLLDKSSWGSGFREDNVPVLHGIWLEYRNALADLYSSVSDVSKEKWLVLFTLNRADYINVHYVNPELYYR